LNEKGIFPSYVVVAGHARDVICYIAMHRTPWIK